MSHDPLDAPHLRARTAYIKRHAAQIHAAALQLYAHNGRGVMLYVRDPLHPEHDGDGYADLRWNDMPTELRAVVATYSPKRQCVCALLTPRGDEMEVVITLLPTDNTAPGAGERASLNNEAARMFSN